MKVMGLVGMLSICSVEDLWKRQIHLVVISAFGILGVLLHFYDGYVRRYAGWHCAVSAQYFFTRKSRERGCLSGDIHGRLSGILGQYDGALDGIYHGGDLWRRGLYLFWKEEG